MKPFQRYLLNKLFWYLLAFVAAMALNFFLPRLIPGNPVDAIVSQMARGGGTSGEALSRVYDTYITEFGLDKSPVEQFISYLGNLFRGDLGTSLGNYPASVNGIIGAALPWTLALQLPTILLGWILGNIFRCAGGVQGRLGRPGRVFGVAGVLEHPLLRSRYFTAVRLCRRAAVVSYRWGVWFCLHAELDVGLYRGTRRSTTSYRFYRCSLSSSGVRRLECGRWRFTNSARITSATSVRWA